MTLEETIRDVVRTEVRAAFRELKIGQVDDLMTYAAAAEFAKVSSSLIVRWVARGVLPATGRGKLRRVKRSDVLLALQRSEEVRRAAAVETPEARGLRLLDQVAR